MRQHNRRDAYLRKGWKGGSTKQNPKHTAAPDLVNRRFDAEAPNRLWVADLTRITGGDDRGRCCAGEGAAGQRPAHRRGHR